MSCKDAFDKKFREMNKEIESIDHEEVFAFIKKHGLEKHLHENTSYKSIKKLRKQLESGPTSGDREDLPHPVAVLEVVAFYNEQGDNKELSKKENKLLKKARKICSLNAQLVKDSGEPLSNQGIYDSLYTPPSSNVLDAMTAEQWVLGTAGKRYH